MAILVGVVGVGAVGLGIGAYKYFFGKKLEEVDEEYTKKEVKTGLLPEATPRAKKVQVYSDARKELKLDGVNKINIGFCGQTKAGKSRLVNTLRKVKKGDPDWAPEGESECTLKITPYPLSEKSSVVFWDIPGAGTANIASDTYFSKNFLYIFDVLLLMISETLREEDIVFARLATEHKVPWAFVRSKCDRELRNNAEEIGIDVDAHIMMQMFDKINITKQWNANRKADLETFQKVKTDFIADMHKTLKEDLAKFASSLAGHKFFCISSNTIGKPDIYQEFQLDEVQFDQFIAEEVGKRRQVTVPSDANK